MSQTRNYRKLIKRIEKENEPITNLFDLITPEYILENESKFEKAFLYFTPNEYDKIKDYKSTKAVNIYINKYELPIEEQQYWLKLAMLNNKRIENMEKANLEYIKSLDTEFAYEVLLKIGYTDDIKYLPKEQKNLKYYKKLACNNFDYLGELVIKHSLVEPYALRLFYTSTTIDSTNKVYKHIAKMYAINPTFMICYVLNKQPTKKALRTVIDENMIGILNDCTLLAFLLQKYESSNNKMDIVQILMKQNRKIDTIEEFVLNNVQIPERIAKLLSIIAGFLSNDTDWFAIFYHEDVPYQKYTELYHKIHRINHQVKLDFERIEYFMQYAFYKTNFTATFDPLNYVNVSPNDFLKKHLSQRDDIDFYCKLPDIVKNNINPIYRETPEYMRDKKRAVGYYKSFKNFTPHLLDSKLGILYIEQNLSKLPVEKAKAIVVANKSLDHPLNVYLDEYIWNNYPCISSFYIEFKKQHDNNLNNIINQINCKLNFDVYVKYKSYESECSRHLSETYTLADMIRNYHKSPELVTKALSYKLESDLDQVINFLLGKPAYKPILHDLVDIVDDKYVAQIFDIIINNHKNDKDLIFMLASKDTSLLARVLVAIKDNCTVEDARKINVLITENNINVDYSGNLFFNIATNNDPTMISSTDNNLKYLLEIHDFYKPYIISNFGYICTQINSGCNDDWVIRCIETICADIAFLFLVKDDIKRIFYENPETKILQHLSNSNGYFTKELFNLSKHFVTAKTANRVLQTTNTDDFLKLPDKDLISTLHSMTFDCYLDNVSADYLLLRLDTLLFAMQKTTYEREFCKNVFRTIYTLDEIVYNCNYDLILINLINLISDDRFTSELADIFDKLATKDVKIIDTLVSMLDKDINISKIVVSILMRIEKDDSEYVERICSSILASPNLDNQADDSKAVINFLAYAPALKSFAKYKNNFLSELKQIYLGNNVEIAMKAFSKLYSDEIRNFIIGASFMHARKSEALNIIEKNFDADDINLFALIYILKFDKNEKIRSKAHELWIKNFKQGVINAVIPHIIIMCHYHREDDLLFEYAIHDFISKYSYNIEKEIITLIEYLKSREDTAHPKIDALSQASCLYNCVDEFELSLTESVCYFIKEGLKLDLLKDAAIEFLQLNVDIEIVQDLLHEPKYQDVLLSMILDNKIEFEVVLTNKGFVDEIYKKTGDDKLLPYLSTSLKMKELPKNVNNIDKIFYNTAPSKEWELFLSNSDPAFSKSYLKNYVCDFGGLKVIFDRVCEECTDIDDLINLFYIDYLKYVSYKNFNDIKKLVKLLIETRNYKRLRELQDHIDFETLCQLLRLSLEETDIASVLSGYDYQNEVIDDYIDIMSK